MLFSLRLVAQKLGTSSAGSARGRQPPRMSRGGLGGLQAPPALLTALPFFPDPYKKGPISVHSLCQNKWPAPMWCSVASSRVPFRANEYSNIAWTWSWNGR